MKKFIRSSLVRAALFVILTSAQGTGRSSSQDPSQTQLAERFARILAEKLDKDDVQVSEDARSALAAIVNDAANTVAEKRSYEKLDDADKAFKKLAVKLLAFGHKPFEKTEINGQTVDDALHGKRNPHASDPTARTGGLCPLYPICS